MGNHGPAYYKRYPKEFEKFTPVCKTNQLENCTKEEISNAYDNAILYTDYFLSKAINFLKKYSNRLFAIYPKNRMHNKYICLIFRQKYE